jgi:hypothetical protein
MSGNPIENIACRGSVEPDTESGIIGDRQFTDKEMIDCSDAEVSLNYARRLTPKQLADMALEAIIKKQARVQSGG